jgi:tRNA nucleotidyltransferase (CCA-adding enzyme)
MQVYVVGGAVRDELLGLPVADRDWVVVGATPEEMVALGYTPVGRDFPVFLHPETHEEYALARTERKSGRGYRGFTVYSAPDVTLEDDLKRRDLTINSMARAADGRLIDPFGGEHDLKAGVLRHVGDSFVEDPVRMLRVARFAARFRFRVADDTLRLMRRMVDEGEADHLVPERVWQEFARGLCEAHPEEMFLTLERCRALVRLMPELDALFAGPARDAVFASLSRAVGARAPLALRFAALAWFCEAKDSEQNCEAAFRALCDRLRAPTEVRDLAVLICRCRERLRDADEASPTALLALFKTADAFRRAARFAELLSAAALADPQTLGGAQRIRTALHAAAAIDAGAIARSASSPAAIAAGIDAARLAAIGAASVSGAPES